MQVISIIVSTNECPVVSIDTFGVLDDENKDATVADAESHYYQKCVDLKFGEECLPSEAEDNYRDEIGDTLDDGYCEVSESTVSFAWSSIDNVQL